MYAIAPKESCESTLLPSEDHVATVSVDRHWRCIFPRHLDPLKLGMRLSEGMLPLCSGIPDFLYITRRTGNTALLHGHVPMDFIKKYPPKGTYPRLHCAAKDVCVPPVVPPRPVVIPQPLLIRKEAEQGANAAFRSPTRSEVYVNLHPSGNMTPLPGPYSAPVNAAGQSNTENCAVSLYNTVDPYAFMDPAVAHLELLPEGDSMLLGPPHQLLPDEAVLDTREAGLPVDTGAGNVACIDTEQKDSGHTMATSERRTSTFHKIKETLAVDTSRQ